MSDVSLKEHLETCLGAMDRQHRLQLESMEKLSESQLTGVREAVKKAEEQLDIRLAAMNEWRSSLNDVTTRLVTRPEHDTLERRIHAIELAAASGQGRATVVSGLVAAGVSIIVGVIIVVVSRFLFK